MTCVLWALFCSMTHFFLRFILQTDVLRFSFRIEGYHLELIVASVESHPGPDTAQQPKPLKP